MRPESRSFDVLCRNRKYSKLTREKKSRRDSTGKMYRIFLRIFFVFFLSFKGHFSGVKSLEKVPFLFWMGSRATMVPWGPGPQWSLGDPCWTNMGPTWTHVGPTWVQHGPNMGPTWIHVGPTWVQHGPMLVRYGSMLVRHGPRLVGANAD